MSIDNFNIEHRLRCLVICLGHTCTLVGYLQRTSSVLGTVWPQWCQCEQGSVLHQEHGVEAEKDAAVKSCTGPVRTLCGMLTGWPVSVGHSLAHNLFSLRVPAFLLGRTPPGTPWYTPRARPRGMAGRATARPPANSTDSYGLLT